MRRPPGLAPGFSLRDDLRVLEQVAGKYERAFKP